MTARRATAALLLLAILGGCANVERGFAQLDSWAKRNFGDEERAAPATPRAPLVVQGETGPVLRYRSGEAAPAAARLRAALDEMRKADADLERAAALLFEAAGAGNADAAYLVAITDTVRPPEQRNREGARAWLLRAALHGHPTAQRDLGAMYADGSGVRRDDAWANLWYERAALRGDATAAYRLALRQVAGIGTEVNLVEAYRWLVVAEAGGEGKAAQYREAVAARLDTGERARIDGELRAGGAAAVEAYPDPPLVRYVQATLNRQGLDAGPADGRSGPRTVQAVGQYRGQTMKQTGAAITPDLVARLRQG